MVRGAALKRALRRLADVGLVAVLVALAVPSFDLAEAFLGRTAAALLGTAVLLALVLRRPVPSLGWVRAIARRCPALPLLAAPGIELFLASVAALAATWLAAAAPALVRGPLGADGFRVDDLVHGWRSDALGWWPERRWLVALHGGGAERYGFTIVDLTAEPPVARLWPVSWTEEADRLTLLPGAGAALAHSRHARRRLWIDLAARTAEVRAEEGVLGSTYEPVTDRLSLVRSGEPSPIGRAPCEVVTLGLDDYRAGRWDAARRYPIPSLAGPVEVVADGRDRLLLRGDGARGVGVLDLGDGSYRSTDLSPMLGGLALGGARAYVTDGARSSVRALALDRGNRLEVVGETWVGGVPGPVAVLAEVGAVAVGARLTGELLLLDARTLEVRARLATCAVGDPLLRLGGSVRLGQIRDLAWDAEARALYVANACGLRRVRFPAGWHAASGTSG